MKRIFSVLLAGLLMLSACTPQKPDVTPEDPDKKEEETPVEKVSMTARQLLAQDFVQEADDGVMFQAHSDKIYNYCPSVMELPDGTRHIYFCTNKDDWQVHDHIGYRKAVQACDTGEWYYGPLSYVLTPLCYDTVFTAEDYKKDTFCWYSRHICDPSVIAGEFKYYDHTYPYLMAVLVCANGYCLDNEVAFAVADKPEGPWTLCDDTVNPCVKCKRKMADWGVGQPDIISVDQKGQILLTYTMAGVGAVWQLFDCSDLQHISSMSTLTSPPQKGTVKRSNGVTTFAFYNAAYAYDSVNHQILMLVENMPHALETEPAYPSQVGSVQCLYSFSVKNGLVGGSDELTDLGIPDIVKKSSYGSWNLLYTVDPQLTGYPRNHNACIIRDQYGWVAGQDLIELAVTVNDAGNDHDNTYYLWSYRIARIEYKKESR